MGYVGTFGATPSASSLLGASISAPPFNPADYEPKKFALDQSSRWGAPAMQQDIASGRKKLGALLNITLPPLPSMPGSEITSWSFSYISQHGPPTDLETGAKMTLALASAQGVKLGVPPEWVAGADLLVPPPQSTEQAQKLVVDLGVAYIKQFGVPLIEKELVALSSRLAMVTQGIPVEFAIAGFQAFKDGKLSLAEVEGIAIQAAAYAGAVALQAIGIPAPLGAILCSITANALVGVVDNVIHADDAQMRAQQAAVKAAEKLRVQLMSECAKAAQDTWNKTQEFWDQVLVPVQSLLDIPQVASRLQAAGGIRYFGKTTVTLPAGIALPDSVIPLSVLQADAAAKHAAVVTAANYVAGNIPGYASQEMAQRHPLVAKARAAAAAADKKVAEAQGWRQGGDWSAAASEAEAAAKKAEALAAKYRGTRDMAQYALAAMQARFAATAAATQAQEQSHLGLHQYGYDCIWWSGAGKFIPNAYPMVYALPGAVQAFPNGCLYFTRAEPVRSFAEPQKFDVTTWTQRGFWADPADVRSRCASRNADYLTFRSDDSEEHCKANLQTAAEFNYQFNAKAPPQMLVRITPYTDHSSPVRSQTVTVAPGALVNGKPDAMAALLFWGAKRPLGPAGAVINGDISRSDVAQWAQVANIDTSQVSGKGTLDISANYCDLQYWITAVMMASAASAAVQQDIIRTVAWQVGVENALSVAKNLKDAGDMVAYATAVKAKNLKDAGDMVAYATAVKAAKDKAAAHAAAALARQAASASRSFAAARAASGVYRSALAARAAGGAVTAEQNRKRLIWAVAVVAVVAGAGVVVYRKKHRRS